MRRRLYRPTVLLMIGMIPMLFALGSFVRRTLPDLGSRPEYRLAADRIDVEEPPPWLPADFTESVLEASDVDEERSLLDDEVVRELAAAFEASPWVASVKRVRKLATGRITVDLEFREPVAMVRLRRISYPVDVDGVLLPAKDFPTAESRHFPLISGIVSSPGLVGQKWDDPVVLGATRIAESLANDWEALDLSSIRVRVQESRGKAAKDFVYELVTSGGSLIVWGRAPGSRHPGELSVRQKLGKVARYLEKFGSFENPGGPYEIDIRHWREITRQRIASQLPSRS